MRLRTRLLLAALGLLAATAAVLLYANHTWVHRHLEADLIARLEHQSRLVALAIPRTEQGLNAAAHRYGRILERRVTIVHRDGTVLGDSEFDDASLALLENHATRPEIADALGGRTSVARRVSASTNQDEIKVAIPAWPGALRLSAPADEIERDVGLVAQIIIAATLAGALLAVPLTSWLARSVTHPLDELRRVARTVGSSGAVPYPQSRIPAVRELIRTVRNLDAELSARLALLEREREETAAMLESMAEGVIGTDARGDVVYCNAAARRILGFEPEGVLPNLRKLFHQRDAREVVADVLGNATVIAREVPIAGRNILLSGQPLPGGGAVLSLLDVTDLRQLQAVRRDFVANVSHELKTPLTSILGYAETLAGDSVDDDTERRFLATILDNARRMQRLVDDLLDLARLESGAWEPRLEPLDLAELVGEAWASIEERATRKRIALEVEVAEPMAFTADAQAMHEILVNLFDNAVRHTPAGGAVAVSARHNTADTEILVRDTGSGIAPEHLPRVFERFYRADAGRSRTQGGTGLGLAIVKHLVEGHGGTVELDSELGEGTTVRLRFPHSLPGGVTHAVTRS